MKTLSIFLLVVDQSARNNPNVAMVSTMITKKYLAIAFIALSYIDNEITTILSNLPKFSKSYHAFRKLIKKGPFWGPEEDAIMF